MVSHPMGEQIQALRDILLCHEKIMADYRLEIARLTRIVDRATHFCFHDFSFDSDVCHLCGETK